MGDANVPVPAQEPGRKSHLRQLPFTTQEPQESCSDSCKIHSSRVLFELYSSGKGARLKLILDTNHSIEKLASFPENAGDRGTWPSGGQRRSANGRVALTPV